MDTPDFILALREKIGHDLLPIACAAGVVLDDTGSVLLGRRTDDGRWAVLGGIIEPGEQPADAVAREIREEAGIRVVVDRLSSVVHEQPIVFPNGDRCQVLALAFVCRHLSGDACPADGENVEVRWFAPDELPTMSESDQARVDFALSGEQGAFFIGAPGSGLPDHEDDDHDEQQRGDA